MVSLLDNTVYIKKRREFDEWSKSVKNQPLPEPKPIIFPEGTTREDVYPKTSNYHGD